MNTKNKRVSHPKHLKNQIYLGFLKELKAQLDMDSTVSTSKIAEQFNCSKQVVTVLKEMKVIIKTGIKQHCWVGVEPNAEMVIDINNRLLHYQMDLRLRKKLGTFKVSERKIQSIELNNNCAKNETKKPFLIVPTVKSDGELEFDFDAPDIGKRETLGERQMRKSTKVIELDENAMKAWEQKMKEQKAEKSDIPFIAPTDSSMVSEFIDHERHDDFIHLSKWEKTIVFGMIGLIATLIISVAVITYFVIKQI